MASTSTLNVRMDSDTKESYQHFCDEVGVSASSLMNMFAKYVIRNQRVPFSLSSKPDLAVPERYAQLFPSSEAELDQMLALAESTPENECLSLDDGFALFERRMGW